ncbi:MAG: GNAT family N-acetyltransferase, partial [Comamonadaceae bacterium]
MASTEAAGDVQVQPLARLDRVALPMLDDLVVQSGWNQTADDWGVFARHGHIGVVRDASHRIVASGAVLPMGAALHGGSVAWISMILVSPGERGRGLGRAVFAHCLETAQAAGHVPMLDATPAGEPLYLQFGFAPLWAITRWRRPAKQAVAAPAAHDPPALGVLIDLDAQALGFRRPGLLAELAGRADARCVRVDGAVGVVRCGRVAHQIGPVLATDDASACALVQ